MGPSYFHIYNYIAYCIGCKYNFFFLHPTLFVKKKARKRCYKKYDSGALKHVYDIVMDDKTSSRRLYGWFNMSLILSNGDLFLIFIFWVTWTCLNRITKTKQNEELWVIHDHLLASCSSPRQSEFSHISNYF